MNGGLKMLSNKPVSGFSFTDSQGNEIETEAKIVSPKEVIVCIPDGASEHEMHYAMYNDASIGKANLCDGSGLPVPAFCFEVV